MIRSRRFLPGQGLRDRVFFPHGNLWKPVSSTVFQQRTNENEDEVCYSAVAKSLGQSEDELKAFMYNMYYDPVLIFIYEVWGRYGQPSPV
jgi:hypothetical protein